MEKRAKAPPMVVYRNRDLPDGKGAAEQAKLPVALIFPGQGSQYVKMLSGIKDEPEVKALLDKAEEILGYDLLDLCLNGPESKLEETKFCQVAMHVANLCA